MTSDPSRTDKTMAIDEDDWRLRCQDTYLQGLTWTWKTYRDEGDDHAHCEFCWAKFMERASPDVLLEGYVSANGYWVCAACFDDFRQRFGWTLASINT